MSRIAKRPIPIPTGVTVTLQDAELTVKGPKGELKLALHPFVDVQIEADTVRVSVKQPENFKHKAMWGTFYSLIRGMIVGVTNGYQKQLRIHGVGFGWVVSGQTITLKIGFSHPVVFPLPQGITATIEKEKNVLTISGIDKQLVGEIAANIRRLKEPEPYKGKGIAYVDEVIRRKAGKQAASASA